MATVRMYWLDLPPGLTVLRTLLAEFEVDNAGQVVATYYDDGWRKELDYNGIYTVATGRLNPVDGRAFVDALPLAFANSSRIMVESVED